jgi:Brp/Blh family beta-carotene 15,15'-monooxygenase
MFKAIIIYAISAVTLIPFFLVYPDMDVVTQLIICAPVILILGIPHGAIDNVLFFGNSRQNSLAFISTYLAIIAGNVLIWMVLPLFAYVLFLILSAYHFGQSQFLHYFKKDTWEMKSLYLLWGISLLSGLIYFNHAEMVWVSQNKGFEFFEAAHPKRLMGFIFILSTGLTVFNLFWLLMQKQLSLKVFFLELLVLALVVSTFYFLPMIIGFTLYFIILHSYKVIQEVYGILAQKRQVNSKKHFIRLLFPFSVLTIVGIFLLYVITSVDWVPFTFGFAFLIAISSITLPHAVVMDRFYKGTKYD